VLTSDQLLKFQLLASGVRIPEEARVAWRDRFGGPLTLAEYATTGGVALVLPGENYVNAHPVDHANAPELGIDGESWFLRHAGDDVPIDVVPVPAFHGQHTVDRYQGAVQPLTRYGVTHTDRCRVSPIEGCAWRCHFCDLPFEWDYRLKHKENLLDAIRAAKDDPLAPARHVLVSGGTPRAPRRARPDRAGRDDEAWIDDVYAFLAEHSPLPVDVMMPVRKDFSYPDWLRSAGVNMVSLNMEVSDPDRARALAAAKANIGRDHTLDYIERAVDSFGVGFVQSLIVFGEAIEPMKSTLRGVRDLVDRGCIPVLSPFRPHHLTPLAEAPAASLEEIVEVYHRTLDICEQIDNGIKPGPRCIPCHHNTATVPDGSDFYVDLHGDLTERRCLTS